MGISTEEVLAAAERWGLRDVNVEAAFALAAYGNLLMHWNVRLSLTTIRDEAGLIERHLMEGAFAAAHTPGSGRVLDFGSGTGVPGIPIAIVCREAAVTLAESQQKKAAFLQEASRRLGLSNATVHAGRAESLEAGSFAMVWMRAVDKSAAMLPVAGSLVAQGGALCLLASGSPPDLAGWCWATRPQPGSLTRVLHIGRRH